MAALAMRCDPRSRELQVIPTTQQVSVILEKPVRLPTSGGRRLRIDPPLCLLRAALLLALLPPHGRSLVEAQQPVLAGSGSRALDAEPFQLIGQVGSQVQLPCLVGKKANCGEPYFVAWYRLNATSRLWARIEHRSDDELAAPASEDQQHRFHLTWPAAEGAGSQSGACNQLAGERLAPSSAEQLELACAHLSIRSLEPADEGRYKCEITFSDSIDFDRCPANTLSQLSVIARPNEPELLVNGRPVGAEPGPLTFKEGAQVRLECQSAGGRPAPRIEWLNVSRPALGPPTVQLMRLHWPQKKTSILEPNQQTPVSSSALSISLSRHDLHSHFACLVLASQLPRPGQPGPQPPVEQLLRSPAYLGSLLNQRPAGSGEAAPMLKWIKLEVQVKPSRVSVLVRDLETGEPVLPAEQQQLPEPAGPNQPFYSVQANRLYAIQCVVEDSRPRSQVHWFNRTAPVSVAPVQLEAADFELPQRLQQHQGRRQQRPDGQHRLSSFSRSSEHPNGTFRTTASLLLTTSIWDNFEELFCRVSNEAFQFDELLQVAPIISARLYVNYAPIAWIDVDGGGANLPPTDKQLKRTDVDDGAELALRCTVAANPLNQNTIIQIEWLKDGRKLQQVAGRQQQQARHFQIEKANHLHMPLSANSNPSATLAGRMAAAHLSASSSLTIRSAAKWDSGNYSCHYKLIPTPLSGASQPAQMQMQTQQRQQHQAGITSGQAIQSVQVNVIEAKPKQAILRISSGSGARPLLVYGTHQGMPIRTATVILAELNLPVSLKCHLPAAARPSLPAAAPPASHQVMWYLDGAYFHSSGAQEVYNFSLADLGQLKGLSSHLGGRLSCAHHLLAPSATSPENFQGSSMKVYHSANSFDFRVQVGPRLLQRRDLMQPMRSFSELELSANPTNKLRLVCVAQCEPLCSLDWYLNGQPAVGTLGPDGVVERFFSVANDQLVPLSAGEPSQNQTEPLLIRRGLAFQMDKLANSESEFRLLEDVFQWQNNSPFAYAWFKETSLAAHQPQAEPQGANGGWSSARQSNREAADLRSGRLDANVFSKLEITYNQLSQLLAANDADNSNGTLIECRLNKMLDGVPGATRPKAAINGQSTMRTLSTFWHALVDSNHWFPDIEDTGGGIPDLSHEPLDLGAFREANKIADGLGNTTGRLTSSGGQLQSGTGDLSLADEMQIRLVLDKPPKGASISLAGISSNSGQPTNGILLNEGQLFELADPNKPAPIMHCKATGQPFPEAQFRWTFTGLNQTEYSLENNEPQLNLRRFLELRQQQLGVDPRSTYGVDVIASIIGNYTCTVSNVHGSRSATMGLSIQGRPLCKLTLGGEFLGSENELMTNLVCSVFSQPPPLEVAWFRSNQQLLVNKTEAALSALKIPIMVLNRQQEYMLADIAARPSANFKCLARNQFGYSESCELSQPDRQMLLKTLKPLAGFSSKSPPLSMVFSGDTKQNPMNFFSTNNSIGDGFGARKTDSAGFLQSLLARFDWLLVIICSVGLIWLLFLIGNSFFKRRYGAQLKGFRSKESHNSNWRFNSAARSQSNNEIGVGVPFQSKVCVNYYGGSNGDSEHDMIQSCSQSSHYEDFVAIHQQQIHQQQQQIQAQRLIGQPSYFNSHPTLNRRPIKSSLSSSSTGESSTSSRHNQQLAALRLAAETRTGGGPSMNDYALGNSMHLKPTPMIQQPTGKLGTSMRETLASKSGINDRRAPCNDTNMTLTSNVPLINGAHTSRINLDQQQAQTRQQLYRFNHNSRDQSTFSPQMRTEHIYDDVIYNQMIL